MEARRSKGSNRRKVIRTAGIGLAVVLAGGSVLAAGPGGGRGGYGYETPTPTPTVTVEPTVTATRDGHRRP